MPSTALTAAVTAMNVNPRVNPTSLVPAMLAAAMLDTAAAPIAAPNSWKVLTIPDASPASWCATFASAVVDAATKVAPMPADATLTPATSGTVPSQIAGTAVPTAATVSATSVSRRGPT